MSVHILHPAHLTDHVTVIEDMDYPGDVDGNLKHMDGWHLLHSVPYMLTPCSASGIIKNDENYWLAI